MISNAYLCLLNVRGKTEQGLVGNSQALPLQFTVLFSDYVIVTLASDFSLTADVTLVDGCY